MNLGSASTAATEADQRDALSAPVRDPLWMIARQWQTGGFLATNGGMPVRVRLSHATAPLLLDGVPVDGPLEPVVEAEPPPAVAAADTATRARLAAELVRRLRDEGVSAARTALAAAFPSGPFAGRMPDVVALYDVLSAGPLPSVDGLDPDLADGVDRACQGWFDWVGGQVTPGAGAPPAWDPHRVEYRFTVTAALPAGGEPGGGPSGGLGGRAARLDAGEYDGTGVDWFTFDLAGVDPAAPFPAGPALPVRPTPVAYAGMPRPAFWELEDGEVNLDSLRATGDTGRALLATFAHQYANDWFVVPIEVPSGVTTIVDLTVTDTFGTVTPVRAVAAIDEGRGPWRMWDLAGSGAAFRLLPPPSPAPLQGPVLEEVLLARDELANLAWVIELHTMDGDGRVVDRYQRHLRLRPASDPAFDPSGAGRADRYRLGTAIADYWYPLVAEVTPDGRQVLTLADVPSGARPVSDEGVAGRIVPHVPGTRIADEEVAREGARLIRVDRLVATGGGHVVWRARAKLPGRGEALSDLRFDLLD